MQELLRLFGGEFITAAIVVSDLKSCIPFSDHLNPTSGTKRKYYTLTQRVFNFLKDGAILYMARPDGLVIPIENEEGSAHLMHVGQREMYEEVVNELRSEGGMLVEVSSDVYNNIRNAPDNNMYKTISIGRSQFEHLPMDRHQQVYYVAVSQKQLETDRYGVYLPWLGSTFSTLSKVKNKNMAMNGYASGDGRNGQASFSFRARLDSGKDGELFVKVNNSVLEIPCTEQGFDGTPMIDLFITEYGDERCIGSVTLEEAFKGTTVTDARTDRRHEIKVFRTEYEIETYYAENACKITLLQQELGTVNANLKAQKEEYEKKLTSQKEAYEHKLRQSDSNDKKNKSAAANGWMGVLEKSVNMLTRFGLLIFGIFTAS